MSTQLRTEGWLVCVFIKVVIEKYLLFLSCLPDLVVESICSLGSYSLSETFVTGCDRRGCFL